jgi:hypothetical protein
LEVHILIFLEDSFKTPHLLPNMATFQLIQLVCVDVLKFKN